MTSGGCFEATCDKIAENIGRALYENARANGKIRDNDVFPQTPVCPANQDPRYELDSFGMRVTASCVDSAASSYSHRQPKAGILGKYY